MPKKAIDILKSFFETGDRPTQEQFADLIDSFHHKDGAALINSKSYDPTTGAVNIQFTDNSSLNFTIPTSFTISQVQNLQDELDNKVDKVDGKGLSANDFTNYFKNLLSAAGSHINDTDAHVSAQDRADWDAKVSPEAGKGLSTNDYDDDELQKVQDATDHIDDDTRHLTPESVASFTENLRAYELGEIIGESQTNVHRIFESTIYKFDGLGDPEDPADDVTYPFECADFAAELAAGRWVAVLVVPENKTLLSEFTNDIGAGEPIVSNTYFVDFANGNDETGEFENASKPYQTIDAVLDLFPRASTNSGLSCRIFLLRSGNYPLLRAIGYYQLEFVSDAKAFVDLTNYGTGTSLQNVYYQGNVSGVYDLVFNLPKGGIKNTSTNAGGFFSSEDVEAFVNIDTVNWTAGGSIISVNRGTTIEKLNTFNSNGKFNFVKNDIQISTLNSSVAAPFGTVNVIVGHLITNDIDNLIPNNCTWTISKITGNLQWSYSHNKTYNIVFNNCEWNSGSLSFRLNTGTFTFAGVVNRLKYETIQFSNQSRTDRRSNINFVNFTCLNFIGQFIQDGTHYKWSFINSFFQKSDSLPLLTMGNNTSEGEIVIQKTTFIQAVKNQEVIFKFGSNPTLTDISVGGLETNAASISNNGTIPVVFDVVSFKDKLGELVVRSKIDLINKVLDPNITYIIDGIISLNAGEFIIVPSGGNLTINGYGLEASVIEKDTANESIFTSPTGGSGGLLMDSIKLRAGAGSIFALEDATTFNAVEFVKVNFEDSASLGYLKDFRQSLWTNIGLFGLSDGLEFIGNWRGGMRTETVIGRNLQGSTGTLFKAGAGLVFNSRFFSNANIDFPTGWKITDFAPANFASNDTFQLQGAVITRNGTFDDTDTGFFPNINEEDDASDWITNKGIKNSSLGSVKMKSADGTLYNLIVNNDGTITTTAI